MACAFSFVVPVEELVPVEPFMQAIHTLHCFPGRTSPPGIPRKTLLSVLCTVPLNLLLSAALTFYSRSWEVPLHSILIPVLGENVQPWQQLC